jgi:signal peptidase II
LDNRAGKGGQKAANGRLGFLLGAVFILAADQISKYAILSRLSLYETIPVIPDFFHLTYIMNSGASFGMLPEKTGLFILLTGGVILLICWAAFFWKGMDRAARILLGLVTGGALGNLTDRIRFGAVVDFLDFRGIWPYVFNVADMAVVCGGILLVVTYAWTERKREKPKHDE